MNVFDKYKELKRSGKRVLADKDINNDNVNIEIWQIDQGGYRVTKYCDCPFVIEPLPDISKYIPNFGGF